MLLFDAHLDLAMNALEWNGDLTRPIGMILDVTHLCDKSFWEALDHFHGRIGASHSSCRALVPDNRQFSDGQNKGLIQRGAVIGGALDAWMMAPGWVHGKTTPEMVFL